MSKLIINAAYHEAGHVVALLLTNIRFKYVTIVPEDSSRVSKVKIPLHIRVIKPEIEDQWDIPSFFIANNFNRYFKNDFIKVAGLVAEHVYAEKNNKTGAIGDLEEWTNVPLHDLTIKLSSNYQKFLLDYTKELFELDVNWLRITAIAEALVERKTLNFAQVIDLYGQSSKEYKESKILSFII